MSSGDVDVRALTTTVVERACATSDDIGDAIQALARLHVLDPSDAHAADAAAVLEHEAQSGADGALRALVAMSSIALVAQPLAALSLRDDALLAALLRGGEQHGDTAAAAAAHLLSQAASDSAVRAVLAPRALVKDWLASVTPTGDAPSALGAIVALARLKLAIRPKVGPGEKMLELQEEDAAHVAQTLRKYVAESAAHGALTVPGVLRFDLAATAQADALEGVYYLAAQAHWREDISKDKPLLQALGKLLQATQPRRELFPRRGGKSGTSTSLYSEHALDNAPTPPTLDFVVVSTIATLVAYPPRLSEEQRGVDALRRSAQRRSGGDDQGQERLLDAAHAAARARRIVDAGLVPPLVAVAVRSTTEGASALELRRQLAALFDALAAEQDKRQRGALLQQGAARALLALAGASYVQLTSPPADTPPADAQTLTPLHALARLSITADPAIMYGTAQGAERAVPFLAALLLSKHATLLQMFEAAMALTNIASLSPGAAGAVARTAYVDAGAKEKRTTVGEAIASIFLMHDDVNLRKALTELLCNLVQDDGVLAYWSGEAELDSPPASIPPSDDTIRLHTAHGRLRLLVSLCGLSDDAAPAEVDMALAASGTLATLATAATTCEHILCMPAHAHAVLAELIWPDEAHARTLDEGVRTQLALRGLTIASTLVQYVLWLRGDGTPPRIAGAAPRKPPADALRATGMLAAAGQYAMAGAQRMMQSAGVGGGRSEMTPDVAQALEMAVGVMKEAEVLYR